jgi:hypothetical protein
MRTIAEDVGFHGTRSTHYDDGWVYTQTIIYEDKMKSGEDVLAFQIVSENYAEDDRGRYEIYDHGYHYNTIASDFSENTNPAISTDEFDYAKDEWIERVDEKRIKVFENDVVGVDVDEETVERLRSGETRISDVDDHDVTDALAEGIEFTTDYAALADVDGVSIWCRPPSARPTRRTCRSWSTRSSDWRRLPLKARPSSSKAQCIQVRRRRSSDRRIQVHYADRTRHRRRRVHRIESLGRTLRPRVRGPRR